MPRRWRKTDRKMAPLQKLDARQTNRTTVDAQETNQKTAPLQKLDALVSYQRCFRHMLFLRFIQNEPPSKQHAANWPQINAESSKLVQNPPPVESQAPPRTM